MTKVAHAHILRHDKKEIIQLPYLLSGAKKESDPSDKVCSQSFPKLISSKACGNPVGLPR